MNWQHVNLNDITPMPWKNGGGTTRELVAWPNAQNWVWRLSVAEVTQGGPFSTFAGVHRWFAVLSGEGVQLSIEQHRHDLRDNTPPFNFSGEAPVNCELLDGPTQDFNLMVKQGVAAHMDRINGTRQHTLGNSKMIAVYTGLTGARVLFDTKETTLKANTLIWQHLPAGSRVQVQAENALWMEIDV